MKNGVSSDESPNRRSASLRPLSLRAVLWKANPEPRSTMPSAARLSGMNNVEKIEANAVENPVQSTTSTKISQTWLASQIGPDRPVDQVPRALAAVAAPGDEAPETGTEVGPAEHGVRGHAHPQHARDRVGSAHDGASAGGPDGP